MLSKLVTLREAILKPRLVGKKLLVRSDGVSLVTSYIMCNGSLEFHAAFSRLMQLGFKENANLKHCQQTVGKQ